MTVHELDWFRVRIHPGRQVRGEPVWEAEDPAGDWRSHRLVRVPGFDGSITLQLHELWQALFDSRRPSLTAELVGLETIVKFGRTMQLEERFTVVIEAEFAT